MRRDQWFFLGGLGATTLGAAGLVVDHFTFGADVINAASTAHSAFFALGIALVLTGAAALVAAFARD